MNVRAPKLAVEERAGIALRTRCRDKERERAFADHSANPDGEGSKLTPSPQHDDDPLHMVTYRSGT